MNVVATGVGLFVMSAGVAHFLVPTCFAELVPRRLPNGPVVITSGLETSSSVCSLSSRRHGSLASWRPRPSSPSIHADARGSWTSRAQRHAVRTACSASPWTPPGSTTRRSLHVPDVDSIAGRRWVRRHPDGATRSECDFDWAMPPRPRGSLALAAQPLRRGAGCKVGRSRYMVFGRVRVAPPT